MKKILLLIALAIPMLHLDAQVFTPPYPEGPDLEFVCELRVICDPAYQVGETAHGVRNIIPIMGGTFSGPRMQGEIIGGGADYQLIDKEHGRTELEAIYSIKTDDGVFIHVRNRGLLVSGKDQSGAPSVYFRTAPTFEAPRDSKYNWLNDAIFVCVPVPAADYICLRVWKVL